MKKKKSEFFIEKFSIFDCKIFNIFEQACFRNEYNDTFYVCKNEKFQMKKKM